MKIGTKGTALAVPHNATDMRALAPEVRLLGHAGRNRPSFLACKGAVVLVVTKKFERESLENRTSGAEALSGHILYGTAEAVPFVQ
jgi:hypothetical protein